MVDQVRVWVEEVIIPTYPTSEPDKNPMFLENRVYQGSSGVVYPHPVIDRVADEKIDRPYNAIFLENRYLKIMLLPEIGGRVQMALDKTNGYQFIYYNRVIKPALVGLTGPWISGGIEFNWPQHHRPSTFDPVDYHIEARDDGSKTAWMGEIERMFRTKGMAGFTLYPDAAYLEIQVQLYNRTSEPQTFLWWANPAVHVNEDYQAIFPPDVHAVMDHGKRDVTPFPIATDTYYKVDYSPGTDISRYKNIPVPTSYMAHHSDFDFLGCYDHGQQAGMMHIANHHIVPGKKQWTWGNGDFGRAWDRQLTDDDGPYAELMAGAYTDNQQDFSWIQPGEEKRFTQILMPFKQLGVAKNACKDAIINLEIEGQTAHMGVYISSPRTVTVQLLIEHQIHVEHTVELNPEKVWQHQATIPQDVPPKTVTLRVLDGEHELIRFTPPPDAELAIPDPAIAAERPEDIASSDELFITGLHVEQYRHATYRPEDYYLEALRRDPHDSRCNNAMGLLLYRRGQFSEAKTYFRNAITRWTRHNPNPYDGESFYNLGQTLKMQGRYAEAYDTFHKAIWSAAWQDSAYFELARLACRQGRHNEALDFVERSLDRNRRHHKAWHLKIALLRHLKNHAAATEAIREHLALDCMDFGTLYEQHLLREDDTYRLLMRNNAHSYIEVSLDYAHAGLYPEAIALLGEAPQTDPMTGYFLGWYHIQNGDEQAAQAVFEDAAQRSPDYCFPHRLECILAFSAAMEHHPEDGRAPYYLGNFWYAHRRYAEAIACWERARDLAPDFPVTHRNLGLAYLNKQNDMEQALAAYEQAFALAPTDARVFFELDQLYKKHNEPPHERLHRLDQHDTLVQKRDDLTIERIALLNRLARYQDALDLLLTRNFHPWEGGEGKVAEQYVISLTELARQQIAAGDFASAIDYLERAQVYPHNLGEGKLSVVRENNIHYFMGLAYESMGDDVQARAYFTRATAGPSEPFLPMYYNDGSPDMIFYQALAHEKLGQAHHAETILQSLVDYGTNHLGDHLTIDYFAVSLPESSLSNDTLDDFNRINCHYLMALGYLGLRELEQAAHHFDKVLSLNIYHLGAVIHQAWL